MLDSLEAIAVSAVAITTMALHEIVGPELTFLGWRVLVVLGEDDAPMRLSDLAGRLSLSRPSASKLAHRLERRGLVALVADSTDGRGVGASLTAEGKRLRHAVFDRRREMLTEALVGALPDRLEPGFAIVAERLGRWR